MKFKSVIISLLCLGSLTNLAQVAQAGYFEEVEFLDLIENDRNAALSSEANTAHSVIVAPVKKGRKTYDFATAKARYTEIISSMHMEAEPYTDAVLNIDQKKRKIKNVLKAKSTIRDTDTLKRADNAIRALNQDLAILETVRDDRLTDLQDAASRNDELNELGRLGSEEKLRKVLTLNEQREALLRDFLEGAFEKQLEDKNLIALAQVTSAIKQANLNALREAIESNLAHKQKCGTFSRLFYWQNAAKAKDLNGQTRLAEVMNGDASPLAKFKMAELLVNNGADKNETFNNINSLHLFLADRNTPAAFESHSSYSTASALKDSIRNLSHFAADKTGRAAYIAAKKTCNAAYSAGKGISKLSKAIFNCRSRYRNHGYEGFDSHGYDHKGELVIHNGSEYDDELKYDSAENLANIQALAYLYAPSSNRFNSTFLSRFNYRNPGNTALSFIQDEVEPLADAGFEDDIGLHEAAVEDR